MEHAGPPCDAILPLSPTVLFCTEIRIRGFAGTGLQTPTLAARASSASSAMAALCWSQVASSAASVSC